MNTAPDLLRTIVAATERITAVRRRARAVRGDLEKRAAAGVAGRAPDSSRRLPPSGRVNVIAECKRRSPSKGVLLRRLRPGGDCAGDTSAAAPRPISVLTEPTFFDGSLEHLAAPSGAPCRCPLLRKDFVVDEYQLLEARAAGADAVLLIVAALDQADLVTPPGAARSSWASPRWSRCTTRRSCRRAVDAGARVIGVNNRNLRTLTGGRRRVVSSGRAECRAMSSP